MKKYVWRALSPVGFSLLLAIALVVSTGLLSHGTTAFASTCDGNGVRFCVNTTGSVTVQQPTLHCTYIDNGGEDVSNIMTGCYGGTGNNFQQIGLGSYQGMQQWVAQYGWTYTGTGDGQRYFTFNNYVYFAPMDSSHHISWSDGSNVTGATCYGGGGSCDYQPWNNYISAWISPTAQLRMWVDGSQRNPNPGGVNNLAYRQMDDPQPGNCQGNGLGSTSVSVNVGASVPNGSIGVSSSQNITYGQNGQCEASGTDPYSVYMNLNWEGGTTQGPLVYANITNNAQSYFNVMSFDGKNLSGGYFRMDMNMMVNWWVGGSCQCIQSYDLYGNYNVGPTAGDYAQDTWNY